MFDQLDFSLALKVLTAITVVIAIHQLLWSSSEVETIIQQTAGPLRQQNQQYYQQHPQQNMGNNHYSFWPSKENYTPFTDDEPIPVSTYSQSVSDGSSSTKSSENIISLDLKLKYSAILPPKTTVSEQMLLTLATQDLSLTSRTPTDLVLVVDTSGSMREEKINLLKDTLKYMLTMLSSQDRLSIVRFSHSAERMTPLKLANEQNEKYFIGVIENLYASGGTNIESGLNVAINILRGRVYNDRVSSIFVLSDGQDNDANAESNIRRMLSERKDNSGYTIHTFGYGYDHDPNLMSKIAKMRDGSFYFIEKLATADESFADALGGVATVVAENVAISVRPSDSSLFSHVKLEKAFGGDFIWRRTSEGWYETNINQLSSGKTKNYVLILSLGAYTQSNKFAQSKIAKAVVSYNLPGTTRRVSKDIDLVVRVTGSEEEFERQQPDIQVVLNYYRVRAGEAMQESSKLAEEGKYELGKKTLVDLNEELKLSTVSSDATIVGTISDLKKFIEKMEPAVYKQEGRYHMQQNIGSYLEERSNPYSEKGMHLTNTRQSNMVFESQNRRYGSGSGYGYS